MVECGGGCENPWTKTTVKNEDIAPRGPEFDASGLIHNLFTFQWPSQSLHFYLKQNVAKLKMYIHFNSVTFLSTLH